MSLDVNLNLESEMKSWVRIAGCSLIFLSLTGCQLLVKKVDNNFCKSAKDLGGEFGEQAYYFKGQNVAVCMPEMVANYVSCVAELSVGSEKSTSNSTLDVSGLMKDIGKISVADQQDYLKQLVSDGVIGDARAKAIATCERIIFASYFMKIDEKLRGAQAGFYYKQMYSEGNKSNK